MKKHSPPPDEIRQLISYNPETGVFTWIRPKRKPFLVGTRADHTLTTNGYLIVKVNGQLRSASRLAWWFVHGSIPEGMIIDHINNDKTDNRILNLRLVTPRQNLSRGRYKIGRSGHNNVDYFRPGNLWRVRFSRVNPICKYFKNKEDAVRASLEIDLKINGKFTNRNKENG
jgi:HNH endonuclease